MNRGSILPFSIILSVIIVSVIVASVLIFRNKPETSQDDTPIIDALHQTLKSEGVVAKRASFDVAQRMGKYARVIYDQDGTKSLAFAIELEDGQWKIIEYGNLQYSCERMAGLGFPDALISDCTITIINPISADKAIANEIIKISEDQHSIYFVNNPTEPINITGVVTAKIEGDDGSNQILVYSNETTIPISVSDEQIESVDVGDSIAVTVDSADSNQDNGSNEVVVVDVIEINDVSENTNTNNNQISQELLDQYNLTQEEYDYYYSIVTNIDEPYTGGTQYIPQSFLQLLYDIDNSAVEVQIIGD